MFRPTKTAHAHCDLMCGVYDPAQARIEAQSVLKACEKYHGSDDPIFRQRCVSIKEERAELVKHHLWVLWTDFFKPHHLGAIPDLHDRVWQAAKAAGEAKKTMSVEHAERLIELVESVAEAFWSTDEAAGAGLYPPR
jgi:nickel superoxide dismutase